VICVALHVMWKTLKETLRRRGYLATVVGVPMGLMLVFGGALEDTSQPNPRDPLLASLAPADDASRVGAGDDASSPVVSFDLHLPATVDEDAVTIGENGSPLPGGDQVAHEASVPLQYPDEKGEVALPSEAMVPSEAVLPTAASSPSAPLAVPTDIQQSPTDNAPVSDD
jgi:hypothetical protein